MTPFIYFHQLQLQHCPAAKKTPARWSVLLISDMLADYMLSPPKVNVRSRRKSSLWPTFSILLSSTKIPFNSLVNFKISEVFSLKAVQSLQINNSLFWEWDCINMFIPPAGSTVLFQWIRNWINCNYIYINVHYNEQTTSSNILTSDCELYQFYF